MDSPLRYSVTFLAIPPVSRKSCGLNESSDGFFLGFFCFMMVCSAMRSCASGWALLRQVHPTKSTVAKLYKSEHFSKLRVFARDGPAGLPPINCVTLRCQKEPGRLQLQGEF